MLPASPSRLQASLHEAAAVSVLLVASLAACWPWCIPGRAVFGQRDSVFTVLASHHLQRALLGERSLSVGPLGWPAPLSVTQADFTAGEGLLSLPIEALGVEPMAAMGVVAFLGILLTAWCAHALTRALLGQGPHTWVAGIAAACHPIHLAHAQHVNLLHHEWTLLGALLLGWGLATRRPGLAFSGSAALLAAPWFGLYMGLHSALVAVMLLTGAAVARLGDRRSWLAAGAGLLLGTALFAPVLGMYAHVGFEFEVFGDPASMAKWSWDPTTTLAPIQRSPLHSWLFGLDPDAVTGVANNPANPGYTASLLALLGLVAWRARPARRWAWWVIAAVLVSTALLALGPVLVWNGQATAVPGPYRLLDWIPGFYGLKNPVRWLGVSFMAMGLLGGLGVWWLGRLTRRWGALPSHALGLLLVAMIVAERAVTRTGGPQMLELHPAYLALDEIEGFDPLWDNALTQPKDPYRCRCGSGQAYRAALYHGRPLVGGTAARGTEAGRGIQRVLMTWPSEASVELLRAVGARLVLDHDDHHPDPALGVSCTHPRGHALCLLEPRTPLPDPDAVHTEGDGPVVGLRWPHGTDGALLVRCDERATRSTPQVWRALTTMRHGSDAAWLDLFLEEPCSGSLEAQPRGWQPLYADADAPPWPSPWTGGGVGMAQAFEDIPPDMRNGGKVPVRKHPPGERKPPRGALEPKPGGRNP